MERETILYRGKKYHRYPKSKRRQLRVYFWRHDKWKEPPFALHRQIWIDNFGTIPKGNIIHHKDDNSLNNKIQNLVCITIKEHNKIHYTEERRQFSSENAKRLHNFHGEKQETNCLQCGNEFTFTRKRGAKFCSDLCGNRYRRK